MVGINVNLTQRRLKKVLSYNSTTGIFTRNGKEVGSIRDDGYERIRVNGGLYYSHRLVWLYTTGKWPKSCIDHINGNRSDNRLRNIRLATYENNQGNKGKMPNNTSGFKGVFKAPNGNWIARIGVKNKKVSLGTYSDKKQAHEAYKFGATQYHGEFANYG